MDSPFKGLTVVFDLDGTIADTAPDLIRATNDALEEAGYPHATETAIRPAVAFGARAMVTAALRSLGHEPEQAEIDRLTESMVRFYVDDIAAGTALFPGFAGALDELERRGARAGLCTNKREAPARKLLAELGVLHRFKGLAGGDTHPFRKPDPRHVLAVVEAAGGDPGHAVMVGDTDVDVAAAHAGGMPVIAVEFGYGSIPAEELGAEAVISHFSQLVPRLGDILSAKNSV